jgi:hypothetical protein
MGLDQLFEIIAAVDPLRGPIPAQDWAFYFPTSQG